jgi:hypothetical protein
VIRSFAALAVLLLSACGGSQRNAELMPDERLLACDGLLTRLADVDTTVASETELMAAMNEADASVERCTDAWVDGADSPAQVVLARHRGAQITLRALTFEAALSQRFDEMANYCAIVEDLFALILGRLAEIEAAIVADETSGEDRRKFQELRDLDLETIDVLLVATTEFCGTE